MTRRSLFPSLFLLLTLPAFSQTGDLTVSIDAYERVAGVGYFGYVVHAAWNGAEPATNVVLEMNVPGTLVAVNPYSAEMTCTQSNPVRCTLPVLQRDQMYEGMFVQVRLPGPGSFTATLTGSTTSPETSTANNTATHTVVVAGLPDLDITMIGEPDLPLDPGEEGVLRTGVQNRGETATNVVFRITAPEGGTITSATAEEWFPSDAKTACSVENGEAICRRDSLDPGGFTLAHIRYRAPQRDDGGKFTIAAAVDADQEDFDTTDDTSRHDVLLRRFLRVTSAADDGSGTLRQAIRDANAQCATSPCTISLAGVNAVQPASALPQVTGVVRFDGGTAARPVLDGSLLAQGDDGFVLEGSCAYEVRNLLIRNIPHHAIEARQTPNGAELCTRTFIGFVPGLLVTKTEILGSERGIVTKAVDAELTENVIHENRRSGVFIDGAWYSVLRNNVIVNNGASGVFINNGGPRFTIPPGADLTGNVIHGNAEFGIARTRNGMVQMQRNSLVRNGVHAYDVDLDLSTPNRENDAAGIPNKPELISATYDPASGNTIVRGIVQTKSGFGLDFYASDSRDARGGPQAERWLKFAFAIPNFEVTLPGDLRGQWITATLTKSITLYFLRAAKPETNLDRPSSGADTSELSEAIQVQ